MKWAALITLFLLFDLLVGLLALRFAVRRSWSRLAPRFPAAAPAPDAVTRRFQSFRTGALSLGFAIHTTVDAAHLHLTPARFLHLLGMTPVSIPWEHITITGRARFGGALAASVDGVQLVGPAWCLGLAEPDTPAP